LYFPPSFKINETEDFTISDYIKQKMVIFEAKKSNDRVYELLPFKLQNKNKTKNLYHASVPSPCSMEEKNQMES